MAGRRKGGGRPRRDDARTQRMQERMAAAGNAEAYLTAAYDWFRLAVRHVPDADDRTRLLSAAAEILAGMAAETDRQRRHPE